MHRDKSKLVAVTLVVTALVAAIALGAPALAKSARGGKSKLAASQLTNHATQGVKARERVLNAYGSVRSPTFGGPNLNSPALTGDGSTGYNANLYVY